MAEIDGLRTLLLVVSKNSVSKSSLESLHGVFRSRGFYAIILWKAALIDDTVQLFALDNLDELEINEVLQIVADANKGLIEQLREAVWPK